ncbi:UDP-glucose 4-epimerase GalE [Gottschalkia acidurici 9a]|uniref:UDP-glucose 4-epimerase GalE n=1 Tax=Gottschalkia acidurici (strain ATCC 7906 / DSM 604 / BCRC 14475 / CIP 104303 / KCTC 5404 / NCIMB 10678 / 9a) TaxID=1128398 RepID=K0B4M8_GOTA9|nr:NAD-dependent epimerase/dehydratase family protein [Gottschalkia acidurici]AFS79511.1 UDP-glucose 4-epimerase GalE [Gottschalkia acidurici 9a]
MRKILVTGGAGFIGSHIVDELINIGDKVIIVDNLSTGNVKNINNKAKFYEEDIISENIYRIFEREKPDYVIHSAAQVSVNKSLIDPIYDLQNNVLGTVNVLECCKKYKVKKIVHSSTAAVYGEPIYLGIDEKHYINSTSFYGTSKYASEEYIKTYQRLYGVDYTILRYANVYGDRQSSEGEGGVISILLDKLQSKDRTTIYGDGNQTRDFIYVKDIVKANMLSINKGSSATLNIGTGVETSINELINIIKSISRTNIETIYADKRQGDILNSYFNSELSKKIIGWEPKYTLKEGLKEMLEY